MVDLAGLARRLAEATDVASAAELFAEHVLDLVPSARGPRLPPRARATAARTCPRARECPARDRCLHLGRASGAFAQPPGHARARPAAAPAWAEALRPGRAPVSDAPSRRSSRRRRAATPTTAARSCRCARRRRDDRRRSALRRPRLAGRPRSRRGVRTAALLAAAALRHLAAPRRRGAPPLRAAAARRRPRPQGQLDPEPRPAAAAGGRGHPPHVRLPQRDDLHGRRAPRSALELRAQSARYAAPGAPSNTRSRSSEGIVGRVARSGAHRGRRRRLARRRLRRLVAGHEERDRGPGPDRRRRRGRAERRVRPHRRVRPTPTSRPRDRRRTSSRSPLENARLFGRVKESRGRVPDARRVEPRARCSSSTPTGRIIYANPAVDRHHRPTTRRRPRARYASRGRPRRPRGPRRSCADGARRSAARACPARRRVPRVRTPTARARWVARLSSSRSSASTATRRASSSSRATVTRERELQEPAACSPRS